MATERQERVTTKKKLGAKQILKFAGNGSRSVRYESKELIIRQGDPADTVYFIENGGVQMTVVSDQGKQCVIGVLGAGAYIGECCLTGQEMYLSSASANKATTAIIISNVAMQRALHDQPKLSENFMSFLLTRNGQIEADLVEQFF